jgi:hypothetical protein
MRASGEVSNGEPVQVEIWVNGEWVDITGYDLVRDNSGRITISYGIRGGEGSETQAGTAELQLKNPDGRFTPRNPSGVWYGQIGRNTPIRISVPDGNGGKSYRIWGEVSEWAPNWDGIGNDVWTDVSVNGILQRLAQGPAPERSVIYNAITDPPLTGLVAYWPCEDPTGSIQLASPLTNGSPMTWTGNPDLAAYTGFGASDPLPTLTGASLTGGVARYDTSTVTQYQMRYLLAVPATGFSDLDVISRLQVQEVAAGASLLNYFDIHYNDPPGGIGSYGGPGTLTIQTYDGDESSLNSASISMDVRGRLLRVSLENSISGTTLTSTLRVLDINTGVTDSASLTHTSTSLSRVLAISLAPSTLAGSAGVTGAAAGHLLLQNTITDIEDLGRAIQPAGEAAGRRIQRMCAEAAIPFEWIGDLDDTVAMGPQGKANLLTLVQECVQADGGFLYETAERGLGYRTRASLYNQDPALTLNYAGYNLSEVPVPVEDDRYIQNRITVTVNGVSQSYEERNGALGTTRIGTYGETSGLTLNLASTDAATLRDHAAWRVHLGTVDEARYPKISVNLAHSSITPEMRRAILALRLGDRMQITNMPGAWLPPDTVDQLILGREESITHFEHRLTFICRPASPYSSIGVLDDGYSRLDTAGSVLAAAVSSSATVLQVTTVSGPMWTSDPAETPWNITVGGEVMTVNTVGEALNANPGFETDVSNWTATNATLTRTDSQAKRGTWCGLMTTGAGSNPRVESEEVAVTAGAGYRAVGWLYTPAALAATGVNVNWFDSGHVYISTSSNTATTTAGVWTLYDTVFTAPVGAAYATVLYTVGGTPGAGVLVYGDDIKIIPESSYTSSPQKFTVTRSTNSVTKSHSAGADVRLATPTYIAL